MDAQIPARPMEDVPAWLRTVFRTVFADPRRDTTDPAVWDQIVLDAIRNRSTPEVVE